MNEILSASPRLSEKAIPDDLLRIRRLYFIRCFIPHKLQAAALDRRILSRSIKGYVDPYILFRHQITGYFLRVSLNASLTPRASLFVRETEVEKIVEGREGGGRRDKTFRCNFDRVDNEKSDPKDSKRSLSRIPWPAST